MKILLLQPNYDAHIIHPPLGLGYLAAYLRKGGHKPLIFDGTLKNASLDDFLKIVGKFRPQLIGITVLTRGHNQSQEIIALIKKKYPKILIVIGGTQVTAVYQEIMSSWLADLAVIGEGEETFLELVQELLKKRPRLSKIKGLAYKNRAGKLIINKPRALIANINLLPFPAWDLMPPQKYRIQPILEPIKAQPVAPIMTSRGCPYACSFCASNVTWKRRIRFRSPENVVAEIKFLKDKFGVKEIHFSDDNFTMDLNRAKSICDLMVKEKLNLPWQCPNGVRADRLDLSLLKKMKQAGCYAVGLGIESASPAVLKKNHKNLDIKVVPQTLKNLKKAGIESYGFFILGLPGDTKKRIKKTINFAINNPFDRAWFNIFTPYPGSSAFKEWVKKKPLDQINWDEHDCSTAVVTASGVSSQELEKLQKLALLSFYLRPKIIIDIVKKLGFNEITTLFMSRFFAKLIRPVFLFTHKLIRRKTLLC